MFAVARMNIGSLKGRNNLIEVPLYAERAGQLLALSCAIQIGFLALAYSMAETIGLVVNIVGIIDTILRFTGSSAITKQPTVDKDLCELRRNLQSLRPVLQCPNVRARGSISDRQLDVLLLLRNSRYTAERLQDFLRGSADDEKWQETIPELTPSIRMISIATTRLRVEVWQRHLTDNSLNCQVFPIDPDCTSELLAQNGFQPARPEMIHSMRNTNKLRDPCEILAQQNSKRNHTIRRIAKTVSNITAYLSSGSRKRVSEEQSSLATLDTAKEYLDCAAWFLECMKTATDRVTRGRHRIAGLPRHRRSRIEQYTTAATDHKETQPQDLFPDHRAQRFFCIRAICCVRGALRKLTIKELFSAVTTKILPDDLEWPFGLVATDVNIQELMYICRNFLQEDNHGLVSFRDDCERYFTSSKSPVSEQDSHLFLALVCLKQLKSHPRLILKPWLCYHELEAMQANFALHRYISICWQDHCMKAERSSEKVADSMHSIIQAAWLSLRGNKTLIHSTESIKELDMLFVQGEALDIGLELSIDLGFNRLADSYRRMGAKLPRPQCQQEMTLEEQREDEIDVEGVEQSCYRGNLQCTHVLSPWTGYHGKPHSLPDSEGTSPSASTGSFDVITEGELETADGWVVL